MTARVVWKYEVPDGEGRFQLVLPAGAEFSAVIVEERDRRAVPVLYFVVDPDAERWLHTFHARDTGEPLEHGELDRIEPAVRGNRIDAVRFLCTYRVWLPTLMLWNVRHVWMEV